MGGRDSYFGLLYIPSDFGNKTMPCIHELGNHVLGSGSTSAGRLNLDDYISSTRRAAKRCSLQVFWNVWRIIVVGALAAVRKGDW